MIRSALASHRIRRRFSKPLSLLCLGFFLLGSASACDATLSPRTSTQYSPVPTVSLPVPSQQPSAVLQSPDTRQCFVFTPGINGHFLVDGKVSYSNRTLYKNTLLDFFSNLQADDIPIPQPEEGWEWIGWRVQSVLPETPNGISTVDSSPSSLLYNTTDFRIYSQEELQQMMFIKNDNRLWRISALYQETLHTDSALRSTPHAVKKDSSHENLLPIVATGESQKLSFYPVLCLAYSLLVCAWFASTCLFHQTKQNSAELPADQASSDNA